MKKLVILLFIFLMVGCTKTYTYISYDDFMLKMDAGDSFMITYVSRTCSACTDQKKILTEVMNKQNMDVYLIEAETLTEAQFNHLVELFDIQYTPTTIFIKDGVETSVMDRLIGYQTYDTIVSKLPKIGYEVK